MLRVTLWYHVGHNGHRMGGHSGEGRNDRVRWEVLFSSQPHFPHVYIL
jgi:hypothetical protein